jgi:hypothetical protein
LHCFINAVSETRVYEKNFDDHHNLNDSSMYTVDPAEIIIIIGLNKKDDDPDSSMEGEITNG